jgi:hypothetical protein
MTRRGKPKYNVVTLRFVGSCGMEEALHSEFLRHRRARQVVLESESAGRLRCERPDCR